MRNENPEPTLEEAATVTDAGMDALYEFMAQMNIPTDDAEHVAAVALFFGAGFAHGVAYERNRKVN